MAKNSYKVYEIDPDIFPRVKAYYGGEIFNREEDGKRLIRIPEKRRKFIERTFKTRLKPYRDEQ